MSPGGAEAQCVEAFKRMLYLMQDARRRIVEGILNGCVVDKTYVNALDLALEELTDSRTTGEMRHISTPTGDFPINVRDEIRGLRKDCEFLHRLSRLATGSVILEEVLQDLQLETILAPYHPVSSEKFQEELANTEQFLMDFVDSACTGVKPLLVTDWDGTMKDYCSQYATNLQPVYSAVMMGRFAAVFTRVTAVLTAGPLRGPGILDLTALPINGPVLFSGSWGREWWLRGRRVVHEDGISEEGFDAIGRLSDEMSDLLDDGAFSQFALVGSGVQRKVDRLTLGVQTVFGHVPIERVMRYIDAVKERIHRVDPNSTNLVLEISSPLEVEVCAHSSGNVWNKGDGVASLIASLQDSLANGKVLVAGDTTSDLPMLQHVVSENPGGVMALFVGASESLRQSVGSIVGDDSRVCFVSCPDVIHAAFSRVLAAKIELD
ncbi:hypothetical protein KIN20_030577 [Parelaphostrongylus tenuis]|uniref:Trehalose-6-phosphate phosphatase helical bundle domain-containing protein n=1 Tax=Parelaphostrongylus tenuis TaxID=148309 RepID=A0AAD5R489_PARTN|nr:hypothetical protein KIN20_030577 [Parelaphostrongylus tenuis]